MSQADDERFRPAAQRSQVRRFADSRRFRAVPQFLADAQAAQAGFGCGPEQISFSGKMAEDGNFANPRQSRDLMRAAGRETLARE